MASSAWASTLLALQRVVEGLAAIRLSVESQRSAGSSRLLPPPADLSCDPFRSLCHQFAEQVGKCDSPQDVQSCGLYDAFSSEMSIPPALIRADDISHLLRFISSAPRAKERLLQQAAVAAFDGSDEMRKIHSAAAAERAELTLSYSAWLAASDHLPVQTCLHRGGMRWSFCSLNVQELIPDGVNAYVSRLPLFERMDRAREVRGLLVEAMLSEAVEEAQFQVMLLPSQHHIRSPSQPRHTRPVPHCNHQQPKRSPA
ncbi:MAG: hypothetical protein SGPRY_010609 [Prymnesium sp.]